MRANRTYAEIETEAAEAEAAIRRLNNSSDLLQELTKLSAAINWFSCECREQLATIENLDRKLRSTDHQGELHIRKIREAAAARAAIAARLMAEMKKMIPDALAQAKKGKPALLRMILRSTK